MKSVSRLFRDWIFSNSLIVIFLLLAGSMLVLTPEEQKFCGHCVTFSFLAVPALIFILQDFLISEENVKEQDNLFATKFVSLLRTGEYFNSDLWKKAYSEYCANHPMRHVSSGFLLGDLTKRYLKRMLKRYITFSPYSYIWVVYSSFVLYIEGTFITGFLDLTGVATVWFLVLLWLFIVFCPVLLFALVMLAVSVFKWSRWLEFKRKYPNEYRLIISSYLEGTAFECSYNCVVIDRNYVHAFDGEVFHTVKRRDVKEVRWQVERIAVFRKEERKYSGRYRRKYGLNIRLKDRNNSGLMVSDVIPSLVEYDLKSYLFDEYKFNIVFFYGEKFDSFKVALDQFQIRRIMDEFFSDCTENSAVDSIKAVTYTGPYDSIKGCTSGIIKDPVLFGQIPQK